jgi:hypothetical protein
MAIKINFVKYENIASAIIVIGFALLVIRPTKSDTEKKINTVIDASAAPRAPEIPAKNVATINEIKDTANAGINAPRHIARLEFLIST